MNLLTPDKFRRKSGYLDIQFDVPSGGSFRVLDVIVAEAPRFSENTTRLASDASKQITELH